MHASQSIADGLEKFLSVERLLEHTAVTWPIERRAMQQVGATGDQDHWQPGPPGLNRSGELKTVHNGHVQVDNNQARLKTLRDVERLLPVLGFKNTVPF